LYQQNEECTERMDKRYDRYSFRDSVFAQSLETFLFGCPHPKDPAQNEAGGTESKLRFGDQARVQQMGE
jgi:hypothetical protein